MRESTELRAALQEAADPAAFLAGLRVAELRRLTWACRPLTATNGQRWYRMAELRARLLTWLEGQRAG